MSASDRVAIENAFKQYDVDGSGYIGNSELHALCAELGAELTERELEQALLKLDTDDSGGVELGEFTRWWLNSFGAGGGDGLDAKLAEIARTGKRAHYVDIHVAAWRGDVAVMQRLIDRDRYVASAEDETDFGELNQPLHYAAYNGHVDACRLLLSKGAPVDGLNKTKCTPLFFAAQQGHMEVVALLQDRGASATAAETQHRLTPLEVAATDEIRELLSRGDGLAAPPRPDAPVFKEVTKSGSVFIDWDDFERLRPPVKFWTVIINRETEDGEFEEIERLDTPDPVSQIQLDKMPSGRTYTVQVSATNTIGTSEVSEPSEAFVVRKLPSRPARVTATSVTSSNISIKWSPSHTRGGVLQCYLLQWRHESRPSYSREDTVKVDAEASSGSMSVKRTGKTFVRVIAWSDVGRSKPSNELMVMVPKSNELGQQQPKGRSGRRPRRTASRGSAGFSGKTAEDGGDEVGSGGGVGAGGGATSGEQDGSMTRRRRRKRPPTGDSRRAASESKLNGGQRPNVSVPVDVSAWDTGDGARTLTPLIAAAEGEGDDEDADLELRVHRLSASQRQRLVDQQ